MERFFKEKINTCVNFFRNTINVDESYQLVETKRKIYYFSKFSLEIEEFKQIHKMVKTLKENIFKNMLDTMKYCVKELITFYENYSEKEQILIIFTICYLHFYTNFSYEGNFSFEDYFNQNLINLCTKYKVYVKNIKQFKIFCYSFYYQVIKELKNVNYAEFQKLYVYYNPSMLEYDKLIFDDTNNNSEKDTINKDRNNIYTFFKNYLDNKIKFGNIHGERLKEIVHKKLVTPLISTTERVVDMVLSIDSNIPTMNNTFNTFNTKNTNQSVEEMEVEKIDFSKIESNLNNLDEEDVIMTPDEKIMEDQEANQFMDEGNNINFFNNLNRNVSISVSTQNSKQKKTNTKSFVSKRILCELIKSDISEKEKSTANDISHKLEVLIDLILNKCQNKIHFIQLFMCNIVEINSELIRMIPEYSDLTQNMNLRFIMPAKNIYNYAVEVYFSINDLYNIDISTFIEVFKNKFPIKFDENLAKCMIFFYKIITDEILKQSNKGDIVSILENTYKEAFKIWENEIIERGQELTRFCTV